MNIVQVLGAMLMAVLTKSLSSRVGSYQVTATNAAGAPIAMKPSMLLIAYENMKIGQTAIVQSGNVTVTVAPYPVS